MVQTSGIKINSIDTPDEPPELFDETVGYDDETGLQFAEGLTSEERHHATLLYRLFNGLWGVCLIVGDPGTGKDLFGNYLSYNIKTYFPRKRILRDEKPRRLFGGYAGLFNDAVLSEDLARMRAVAKGVGITRLDQVLEKAADDWVTSRGQVLLKNSVLYLTEFWRYCYNREPHNPMNKTMGGIHKEKRHLDCLIVGTGQLETELDKKTCLPWIDWRVNCIHSSKNKTGFTYLVWKVKYDRRLEMLVPISTKPSAIIPIDAGKPITKLGDGKVVIKRPDYKPENEAEWNILYVLQCGVDTYEEIVGELASVMSEGEILETLKELKFRKHKRAIDYPCWFGIFNSKSAPQLKTALRVEG